MGWLQTEQKQEESDLGRTIKRSNAGKETSFPEKTGNHGNPPRLVQARLGEKCQHHTGCTLVQITGTSLATGRAIGAATAGNCRICSHVAPVHVHLHRRAGHVMICRHDICPGSKPLQRQQYHHQGKQQDNQLVGNSTHVANNNEFHLPGQPEPCPCFPSGPFG